MKKVFIGVILLATFNSCKSKTESCIQSLIDEKGYTYEEACDECEDARMESEARFEE